MSELNSRAKTAPEETKSATDGKRMAVAVVNFILAGLFLVGGGFLLAAHLFLSVLDFPFQLYSAAGGQPDAETPIWHQCTGRDDVRGVSVCDGNPINCQWRGIIKTSPVGIDAGNGYWNRRRSFCAGKYG